MSSENDVPRQRTSDGGVSRRRLHGTWRWVGPLDRAEDEVLPAGRTFVDRLQHVLTMAAGLIAVSLIIGQAAGLSTASSGVLISVSFSIAWLAIVIQTVGVPYIGACFPVVQGVSFASVEGSRPTMSAKRRGCLVRLIR